MGLMEVALVMGLGFSPVIGDEATYEVTTPVGTTITRRVLEKFDAPTDRYEIAHYQEAQGKVQKKVDWVDGPKLRETYVDDIQNFCVSRSGKIVTVQLDGTSYQACHLVKDNGVLRQDDWWIAHLPFGSFHSIKKSPLHPKAGSETRLMSFRLQER